uniref:G protein-coupled receptor n=1 Tax=Steinernema glaseri TaxID=37863 RepID=A0A1I7ZE46_9BILA
MFLDLYTHTVHTVCLSLLAAVFTVASAFTSYAIVRKTPATLKAYRFLFFYLTLSHQVAISILCVFGPFDVTMSETGEITFIFYGIVSELRGKWIFAEGFLGTLAAASVVGSVWLSFFYRYFQVCHPKSLYSTSQVLQGAVNVVVLIVIPVPVAIFFTFCVWLTSKDSPATEPVVTFTALTYMYVMFGGLMVVFLCVIISCIAFIARVIWTLRMSMVHASERTREMQRMLTITLIVLSVIPLIFGGIPILIGVYVIYVAPSSATTFYRLFFLSITIEGILTSVATVLLVKPYKEFLLSCLGRVKANKVVTVANATPKVGEIGSISATGGCTTNGCLSYANTLREIWGIMADSLFFIGLPAVSKKFNQKTDDICTSKKFQEVMPGRKKSAFLHRNSFKTTRSKPSDSRQTITIIFSTYLIVFIR